MMAKTAYRAGQYDEAAKYYQEAVRLSVDDVTVYIFLAMIF